MSRWIAHARVALCVGLCVGAAGRAAGSSPLNVAASILPVADFVSQVGGSHVKVQVLVGPGDSPHAFEPTPKEMAALSDARVFFRVGVEFEDAVVPRLRRLNPQMRIVDLRAGIELRQMDGAGCDHGEGAHAHEHHDHGRADPHTWLSPRNARIQARTICDALCEADPERRADYRTNLKRFTSEVERVRGQIADLLAPYKGEQVCVFHPAFGYFLDEFSLQQLPVEIEGKEPSARQLARLIDEAKAANVHVVFVQPQFSDKAARAIARSIGGVVVPLDPLAQDYLANLKRMAERLQQGLKGKAGGG